MLPTGLPTLRPSSVPTLTPTPVPTLVPSPAPTLEPTLTPTLLPPFASGLGPSSQPTLVPSGAPTVAPPLGCGGAERGLSWARLSRAVRARCEGCHRKLEIIQDAPPRRATGNALFCALLRGVSSSGKKVASSACDLRPGALLIFRIGISDGVQRKLYDAGSRGTKTEGSGSGGRE